MGGTIGTIYGYEYNTFIQKQKIKQNLIEISHVTINPIILEEEFTEPMQKNNIEKKKKFNVW